MASMLRTWLVPALAVLAVSGATSADAAFMVTTSIVSVNGTQYNDTTGKVTFVTGGTTITLTGAPTMGTAVAYPSEGVALTGTFTPDSASAITVVMHINVTNNGVTGSFTETTMYTLSTDGLGRIPGGVTVTPLSLLIGNNIFNVTNAQATSTGYPQMGSSATPSASISAQVNIAAVPEPASIGMLGLGLVGSVFAARRRLARS